MAILEIQDRFLIIYEKNDMQIFTSLSSKILPKNVVTQKHLILSLGPIKKRRQYHIIIFPTLLIKKRKYVTFFLDLLIFFQIFCWFFATILGFCFWVLQYR